MEKVVLFTKSYIGDKERLKIQAESIRKHNKSDLGWVVSVPHSQFEHFRFLTNYPNTILIADERISESTLNRGWETQQLIKARFYKMGLSKFYVCLDSDSYFIRDFYESDFVNGNIPYLVHTNNSELFEWFERFSDHYHFDIHDSFDQEYNGIRDFLKLPKHNRNLHYGPSPFIWRNEVWKLADIDFGIEKLLSMYPNELKWYGCLNELYKFDFTPIDPLFKCFHYAEQYEYYKQLDFTEDMFKRNYYGIVLQSNWGAPKTY